MKLKDKVAIITGGSRGIGYATADAFLREGAKVVLAGSRSETAEKAVAQLKEKYPDAVVEGIWPKLSDLTEVSKVFKDIYERYGSIDILINNAGVAESTPFEHYTEELFDSVMDLNVKGIFCTTKAVYEYMLAKGKGVIINNSSVVSLSAQSTGFVYPASKFAVNGLSIAMAREFGPKGIRVNVVAPGIINTDMMRAIPKEMIEPLIGAIPLRRMGEPEDIANAFVFLASDEASYINGAILSVDGMMRV